VLTGFGKPHGYQLLAVNTWLLTKVLTESIRNQKRAIKILIDSREKHPFDFTPFDVELETATLPVGDYSLPGFQDRVSIERKNLNDIIGCLVNSNRVRFKRELARGRHYDLFTVVVEAASSDVSQGKYKCDMKPQAALQSIIAFQVRYGVPFVWTGNRAGAEYNTYWLLSEYI